jgi:4-hydroxy-3-polyprenylbenzoate decarboxylase
MTRGRRIVVGISGASGISLAVRFLRIAAEHPDVERLHLVVTKNALRVAASELKGPAATSAGILEATGLGPAALGKIEQHSDSDIGAIIASGSYPTDGMVIIPCSSGMLASIAAGTSRGLTQRAADLTLKERRRLVLGLRETPLSLVHARNIVNVTEAGAIVMPPIPAFYVGEKFDDFVDHFAMRVLDLFDIEIERDDLRWK